MNINEFIHNMMGVLAVAFFLGILGLWLFFLYTAAVDSIGLIQQWWNQ